MIHLKFWTDAINELLRRDGPCHTNWLCSIFACQSPCTSYGEGLHLFMETKWNFNSLITPKWLTLTSRNYPHDCISQGKTAKIKSPFPTVFLLAPCMLWVTTFTSHTVVWLLFLWKISSCLKKLQYAPKKEQKWTSCIFLLFDFYFNPKSWEKKCAVMDFSF